MAKAVADAYSGYDTDTYRYGRNGDHRIFFFADWVRRFPDPPGICQATLTAKFKPRKSHHITARINAVECL